MSLISNVLSFKLRLLTSIYLVGLIKLVCIVLAQFIMSLLAMHQFLICISLSVDKWNRLPKYIGVAGKKNEF